MSIFRKFFSKRETPEQKVQRAFYEFREGVVSIAERKLARRLSEAERAGIDHIGSLMMLEACDRSFSSENYTAAQIEKDLSYFSAQVKSK